MISGQEDVATAVNLINLGAYDYLIKDDETKNRLWNTVIRIREKHNLKREVKALKKEVQNKYEGNIAFIGKSPQMLKLNKEFYEMVTSEHLRKRNFKKKTILYF